MIYLLLLLLLFISHVNASIFKATNDIGAYTIVLVFNNETINTDQVMLTSFDTVNNIVYFQTVSNSSTAENILCRISSQKRVIWGPCGCSNTQNPAQALQSANCLEDNVNIELFRRLFSENWYKSKKSELCAVPGDIRVCAGPVRLAIENRDPYFNYRSFTNEDLLRSRMVFLDGLIGPMAKSPYTVRINMVMPAITVETSCDMPPGVTYQGTYSNYELDPNVGMITTVWKVFISNDNSFQRLLLRRTDPFGIRFSIVLANVLAGAGEYNLDAWSDPISSSLEFSERVFLDWVQSLEWGKNYTMTTSTNGTCYLKMTIPTEVSYSLIKPYLVTPFNYTDNTNPRVMYVSAVCNVCFGRLDIVGNLVCPDVPEGDVGGGDVRYVYRGADGVELPVFVPPNPLLAYRFDCDEVNPKAAFFFDTAGIRWPRMDLDISQLCYYPMYYLGDDIQEKGRQCQLKGGYTFTKAQTLCARPITSLFCQEGWIYFDGKCFWKFDPSIDGQYSSPLDQANNICSQLNQYAQPVVETDQDLENFLLQDYVYWKRNLDFVAAYRVPVYGQSYCRCYLTFFFIQVQCPCYNIVYDQTIQIFPICFYYTSVKELEPLYADIQVSVETARVWKYGQIGPEMGSYEAICAPRDGWKDKGSNTVTCPLEDIINDAKQNTTLVEYFRKCYAQGHGSCFNGQPRVCQCSPYYGPSSSLLPSLPELYQFRDFSCGLPAGVQTSGIFQINEIVYNSSSLYVPCTSIENGRGIYQNNTGTGYCSCTERENLVFGGVENAYDGKSCSCRKPIQPVNAIGKNGRITVELCNHHGTCCPFGETFEDREGNLYKAACFDRSEDISLEGCVGDNGWGGPTDTCPIPFDVIGDRRWMSFNNGFLYYKDLGSKTIMKYVRVEGCGTNITVSLSDEVGKSTATVPCSFNTDINVWMCNVLEGYQFVVASNITLSDDCVAEAYADFWDFCGYNYTTNPFAAEFFNIPAYRGPNRNLEPQDASVAIHGCTSTDCMCNSNFTGFHCNTGVSSLRYMQTNTENALMQLVCGETVANANLNDPVAGRGFIETTSGNCSCNSISNTDVTGSSGIVEQYFTGKACECEMVYNIDRQEVLMCANHGVCELASFPWGRCEVDVLKYQSDALYYPFVPKRSVDITFVDMKAEGDVYFLFTPGQGEGTVFPTNAPTTVPTKAPTLVPTKQPTASPVLSPTRKPTTRSPTQRPTTKTPTQTPTTASPSSSPVKAPTMLPTYDPALIEGRLYYSGITSTGAFPGGYNNMAEVCTNVGYTKPYGCIQATVFALGGINPDWQFVGGFIGIGPTTPVYGDDNNYLGLYGDITSGFGELQMTLLEAGVFPDPYPTDPLYFWTGGFGFLNCNGWSTNNPFEAGAVGNANKTTSDWFNDDFVTCSVSYPIGCLCAAIPGYSTKSPTPFVPPTNSPTSTPPVVKLYRYGTTVLPGTIGSKANSDQMCRDYFDANGIYYDRAASFLRYVGSGQERQLQDLPTELNFPTSSPIKSGPTNVDLGTWATAMSTSAPSTQNVINVNLINAGVLPPTSSIYYTGQGPSTSSGYPNCLDFTTSSSSVSSGTGSGANTNYFWYANAGTSNCNVARYFLCLSVIDLPTLSPTTLSPTIRPTTSAPTQAPTTQEPTTRPTRNPTKRPTTAFPTHLPTLNPTNPTSSPTFDGLENRDIQYLYRLTSGDTISVYNVFYNISLTHLRSSPVNLTVNPVGSFIRPILWTDLFYRRFNPATGLTETLYIDECNPGTPSWIPGYTQIQPDGVMTCPTVDQCILSSDCTDNLSPSTLTTPMSGFPDLRACWCNHSEIVYATVASLDPITSVNVHLFEGSIGLQESVSVPSDSLGSFYCNSFIDRTINCQFLKQDPQYFFRCADEPIGCYDGNVGAFFGAFNQQNPNYNYPVEQWLWTEGHYRGVASVLNNLTYLKYGEFAYPFKDPSILNNYYWIRINETGTVLTVDVDISLDVYQTSLLQAFPYMDILTDIPPPILEKKITLTAKDAFETCYASFTPICNYLNWTNQDFNTQTGRMPGSYSFIPSSNVTYLSFTFTSKSNPGNQRVVGVEIYNSLNRKCGGVYQDEGFSEGEVFTISCLSLPSSNTIFDDGEFSIRFLGANSVYDIPGATLNSEYFHSPYDPLIPYLNLLYYVGSSQTLVLPLAGLYDKSVAGVSPTPTNPLNWPQRQWTNDSLVVDIGFTVTANYTFLVDGETVTNAWSEIADMILEYNIYPENLPLREVQYKYDVAETNFSDPYVLQYLYNTWAAYLTGRRCGGDKNDCKTFKLDTCVVETEFNQVWWNIGNDINYEPIGREGGCNCNHDFDRGYYSYPLLCSVCQPGYAPFTLSEFSLIIQYNYLVSRTFDPGMFPNTPNPTKRPTSQSPTGSPTHSTSVPSENPTTRPTRAPAVENIDADLFEANFSCRYPAYYDPVPSSLAPINFCAGHGIMSGYSNTTLKSYVVWDRHYYISCSSLATKDHNFTLSSLTTSQYSLVYEDGNTILTVVGSVYEYIVTLIEDGDVLECAVSDALDTIYPYPFRLSVICGSMEMQVTCQNPVMFSTDGVYNFNETYYTKNPFITYIQL